MARWTPADRLRDVSETLPPRPIPEARPPHLPDVLTRQSPWVFVFGLVAIVQIVAGWQSWSRQFPIPQSDQVPLLVHSLIPSAVIPLLGVALFIRHPDARTRMPLLVFGLGMLTAVELLVRVDTPILAALSGPEGDLGGPAQTAYSVFVSLLRTFGILYLGAGLGAARRHGSIRAERPLAAWFIALAVIGMVLSIVDVAQLGVQASTIGDWVVLILQSVLTLMASLAWAYVAYVTVVGVIAGESPRRAWIIAAIAGVTLFGFRVIAGLFFTLGESAFAVALTVGYVALVAWLALLVAFALGLPAPPNTVSADVQTDATVDPPAATQPGSVAG
jgi:hypothetical protein